MPEWIIGIDEVGRGCLAGPVMVGVFAIRAEHMDALVHPYVQDSKAVSAGRRSGAFQYLDDMASGGSARYVVAYQDASVVDSIGIVSAIRLCIAEGLAAIDVPASRVHVYLDGGLRAPTPWIHQSTHIKGDRDYPVISAASIVAKVVRDQYMHDLAVQYPLYSWSTNVGYGSRAHRGAIMQHGLTQYHRRMFCRRCMGPLSVFPASELGSRSWKNKD